MKEKFLTFGRMLISNDAVLKAVKVPMLLTFLVFIVNVFLISAAPFFGLIQTMGHPNDLENAHAAFAEIYDNEIDCRIDQGLLSCDTDYDMNVAGYRFFYTERLPELSEIDVSSIILADERAAVVHVPATPDDNQEKHIVSGDYRLIDTLDFSEVRNAAEAANDKETYYADMTDMILNNLYFANIGQSILFIYTAQFMQMLIYIIFISLMFMLANFKAPVKKITYASSIRLTVFAMTGPALLSALLGWFMAGWASFLFIVVYMIRVVMVYFKVNASDTPLY